MEIDVGPAADSVLEYALNAVNQGVTALGIKGCSRSVQFG